MPPGDDRPIGVFDSGVGGLTVLRAIHDQMPLERTIYVGDLLHFPYGPRYQEEVKRFAFAIIRYLAARDVKLVVIACNTATAAALHQAREVFDVPIVGVISPGAQAAVEASRKGLVGVISTEGTRLSQEYLHAIKEIDPMIGVYQKACPELVGIVEAGEADSVRAENAVRRDLAEIEQLGADALVLACTHYPLLMGTIERVFPGRFTLVDSGSTTLGCGPPTPTARSSMSYWLRPCQSDSTRWPKSCSESACPSSRSSTSGQPNVKWSRAPCDGCAKPVRHRGTHEACFAGVPRELAPWGGMGCRAAPR